MDYRVKKGLVVSVLLLICSMLPLSVVASGTPVSYALVVGSNRPGDGQSALNFAKDDADRFGRVLEEVGGFEKNNIYTLYDPNADEILSRLDAVIAKLSSKAEDGMLTNFVFYYSGHARSNAMNLGETDLNLKMLRKKLETVPATFKLVVLDACQTGAISTVKGIEPSRDFSYNSIDRLRVEGMAVLASSAADELSQESATLKGSFFTHHLVSGLRGAADMDGDGLVTLQEAHKYTYNRTLVDTAKTAVGKQHVTFETDMSGEGEMVLTRPSMAEAWLFLPPNLEGEVLIYKEPKQLVMAEIHKVSAEQITLALRAGDYRTLIRQGNRAYRCDTPLKRGDTTAVSLNTCKKVPLEVFSPKGTKTRKEHLFFEAGIGSLFKFQDRYVERLSAFDYHSNEIFSRTTLHWRFSVFAAIFRYLQVGLTFSRLDDGMFGTEGEIKSFEWRTYKLGLRLRGRLPLAADRLVLYGEAGGGLAFGMTEYRDEGPNATTDSERFFKYHVGGGLGLQAMPWTHAGFFFQADFDYAPVIENLIGDTHNSGGISLAMGFRGGF